MDREQFFRVVSGLNEDRLRKALWNLYWRGTAPVRERIEAELASDGRGRPQRPAKKPADPEMVQFEVDDFVSLARSGAYMGGDRRVTPRERTRWRFTFKRLAAEAQDALRAEDAEPAAAALEQLIDLACESHDYDYFRSDDPVAAAGFVVSDAVAALWAWTWERHGFQAFAETAAPQLIRWESRHGWTRYGDGPVAAKETSLAAALARMLRVADTWEGFAERYLLALDGLCHRGGSTRQLRRSEARTEQERASELAEWHGLLLEKLADTEGGLLDRIVGHAALGGPEHMFVSARLAHRRGNTDTARDLMARCLRKLPGHKGFREFAAEIGATTPP
ncbi:hypothetical protein MSHI_28160 [Mycobacterium shinjukuense]|uniref:Uncharacterized protein n=1 Tax=Mycobacterium shinjukuense TaxID=398694 RepID=A0A7I7MSI1_9MYCO|nr:hypothetical protein MSHI_28160 [Mycobacterium shinjukuense]